MFAAVNGGSEINKIYFIQVLQMVNLSMFGAFKEKALCLQQRKCTLGRGDEYLLV